MYLIMQSSGVRTLCGCVATMIESIKFPYKKNIIRIFGFSISLLTGPGALVYFIRSTEASSRFHWSKWNNNIVCFAQNYSSEVFWKHSSSSATRSFVPKPSTSETILGENKEYYMTIAALHRYENFYYSMTWGSTSPSDCLSFFRGVASRRGDQLPRFRGDAWLRKAIFFPQVVGPLSADLNWCCWCSEIFRVHLSTASRNCGFAWCYTNCRLFSDLSKNKCTWTLFLLLPSVLERFRTEEKLNMVGLNRRLFFSALILSGNCKSYLIERGKYASPIQFGARAQA